MAEKEKSATNNQWTSSTAGTTEASNSKKKKTATNTQWISTSINNINEIIKKYPA